MKHLAGAALVLVGMVAGVCACAQRGGARGGAVGGGGAVHGGPVGGAPAFHGGYSAPVRPSYGEPGFGGGASMGVRPSGAIGVGAGGGFGRPSMPGPARQQFYSRSSVPIVGRPKLPGPPVRSRPPFYGGGAGPRHVGFGYGGYGYLGYGYPVYGFGYGFAGYGDPGYGYAGNGSGGGADSGAYGNSPDGGPSDGVDDPGARQPAQQDQPDAYGTYPPSSADGAGPTATFGSEAAVTLVFKDGRPNMQIRNYVLTRTTLYVTGAGHREIPVEALDLVATAKLNREAGVEFALPEAGK